MHPATPREKELLLELGDLLRKVRISQQEFQADFAQRIGISVPTYRKMEQGNGSIPLGYWIRAFILLGQRDVIDSFMSSLVQYVNLQSETENYQVRQRVRK